MTKRQRIVITSIVSSGAVFASMVLPYLPPYIEVVVVVVIAYLLCIWALRPDISGEEYFTTLALPTLLTIGVILFSERPNLPIPWKYFIPPIYGVGMYLTLLVENIFNVSVSRTIPLLRAAKTVGYLLTIGVSFIIATLIFTLHLPSHINFVGLFLVGGMVVGQALWQVELADTDRRKLVLASLVSALSVGELGFVISFWPIHPLGAGLAITTMIYFLIGMLQHNWQQSLDRRATIEYIAVGATVIVLLILTTSWKG